MKWLHEGKSQDTLRYKHRGRYGISVNHFFIPLSWDWGRANWKHLIISAAFSFFFQENGTGQLKTYNHLSFYMFFNFRAFAKYPFVFFFFGSFPFLTFLHTSLHYFKSFNHLSFYMFFNYGPLWSTHSFFSWDHICFQLMRAYFFPFLRWAWNLVTLLVVLCSHLWIKNL